ncbi:MAG: hypothetical protein ACXVUL_05275 [Solirubrobacteraceae bacterium]
MSASQVTDPASVVRRYYEVVADLGSSAEELLALLHPDVRIVEHPNPISPRGAVRDRDATVEGFLAGKRLLSGQTCDGLTRDHETFDCYEPFAAGGQTA